MFDVIIAGAGPAGLNAALVLGRQRRAVLLCDDGQARNAATAAMHGFISRDGFDPSELRRLAREELRRYESVEYRAQGVRAVSRGQRGFAATLEGGQQEQARLLLLATGVVDDPTVIDGLRSMWGRSVFHCRHCDAWEARERSIAILALPHNKPDRLTTLALALARMSRDVVVCANGIAFDAEIRQLLQTRGIGFRQEPIARVEGADGRLKQVVFSEGEPLSREVAFIRPPSRQHSDLASQLGCKLLEDDSVEVNDFGQTSVPGVLAAGDMARRPAMPFAEAQVILAAGAGVVAGIAIDEGLLRHERQAGRVPR
jgi:thioredoxin reductase